MGVGRTWLAVGVVAVLAAADWGAWRLETPARAAPGYPAPRFPRYLRTVTSVEPLMPSARLAARQIGGRTPLGLVQRGEHLVVAVPDEQDPLVLEAIKRALEERGVKVTVLKYYQLQGLTEAQARENLAHRKRWLTYGDQGWKEIGTFNTRLVRFLSEAEQRAIAIPPPPHPGKDTLEALVAQLMALGRALLSQPAGDPWVLEGAHIRMSIGSSTDLAAARASSGRSGKTPASSWATGPTRGRPICSRRCPSFPATSGNWPRKKCSTHCPSRAACG